MYTLFLLWPTRPLLLLLFQQLSKIMLVVAYPVFENRCNRFLGKNAATPDNAIPCNP